MQMKKSERIIAEALEQVQPKLEEKEKIIKLRDNVLKKVKALEMTTFEPKVVGSIAKGTFLAGTDIDIFNISKGSNLKKEGLDVARKILPNGKELYAQHPLFERRNRWRGNRSWYLALQLKTLLNQYLQ